MGMRTVGLLLKADGVSEECLANSAAIVAVVRTWAKLSKASGYFDLGDWVPKLQSWRKME
jgi:hypothetical protein